VDAPTSITVIDTTIFIIDLRYKRDKHFASNRAFLEWVAQTRSGVTTLFNLLYGFSKIIGQSQSEQF
jgi:hypothetical protein